MWVQMWGANVGRKCGAQMLGANVGRIVLGAYVVLGAEHVPPDMTEM